MTKMTAFFVGFIVAGVTTIMHTTTGFYVNYQVNLTTFILYWWFLTWVFYDYKKDINNE